MKLYYADESGNTGMDLDNKEQPIFVLGSICLEDKNWHEINNYFNKRKVEIFEKFQDIEIHTNEIFSPPRKSIFHIKNWKENFEILNNLIDLIIELDIEFNFVAIDKKNFKLDLQQRYGKFVKLDPYFFAFTVLYNDFSEELEKNNDKGIIFLDEILDIPDTLNKIYPKLSENNNSIIEKALFLKSKDTNFIQIADILTFYVCQYLNISNGNKKCNDFKRNHCIENYKKILTKTNKKYLI